MSTARTSPRPPRRLGGEAGFGLLETVVAMLVLSVVALAVLSMLATAQKTAYGNRARVVAANLAASEMDSVRSQARSGLSALSVGTVRPPVEVPVSGTVYEVSTQIAYVKSDDPATLCGTPVGIQPLNGVRVNVSVTWGAMGLVDPVTSDTVIAPTLQDATASTGTVVTRVVDRDGGPVAGAVVKLPPKQAVTTAEGCAIITEVTPGPAEVTAELAGSIAPDGTAVSRETVSVKAGAATNLEAKLDSPATVTVTGPADPAQFPLPVVTGGTRIHLANVAAPGGGRSYLHPSSSTSVGNLFPYADGYRVSAGPCPAPPDAAGTPVVAVTERGGTRTVAVPWKSYEIVVNWASNQNVRGYAQLVSRTRDLCPTTTYSVGTAAAPAVTGTIKTARVGVSMPTGVYDVVVHYSTNGGATWEQFTIPDQKMDASVPGVQKVTINR